MRWTPAVLIVYVQQLVVARRPERCALPEPSSRRRALILAICCMSLLIVGLDNTIVNVALPSLRQGPARLGLRSAVGHRRLHPRVGQPALLAGSTGDRLGRRRIFQIGLTLFTLGSLLCSLAPSLSWLVAPRTLQAVGGSMLNPVAMGIITNTFTIRANAPAR